MIKCQLNLLVKQTAEQDQKTASKLLAISYCETMADRLRMQTHWKKQRQLRRGGLPMRRESFQKLMPCVLPQRTEL